MKFLKAAHAKFLYEVVLQDEEAKKTRQIFLELRNPYSVKSDELALEVFGNSGLFKSCEYTCDVVEIPDIMFTKVHYYLFDSRISKNKLIELYNKLLNDVTHTQTLDRILILLSYKLSISPTVNGNKLVDSLLNGTSKEVLESDTYYAYAEIIEDTLVEPAWTRVPMTNFMDIEYKDEYLRPDYPLEFDYAGASKHTSMVDAIQYYASHGQVKSPTTLEQLKSLNESDEWKRAASMFIMDFIMYMMEDKDYLNKFKNFNELEDIKGDGYWGYSSPQVESRLARYYRLAYEYYTCSN